MTTLLGQDVQKFVDASFSRVDPKAHSMLPTLSLNQVLTYGWSVTLLLSLTYQEYIIYILFTRVLLPQVNASCRILITHL